MKATALIVEDQESVAYVWSMCLEKLEMVVRWARSLEEALEMALILPPPDLILLDLRLDDSGDLNTIRHIKDLKKGNPDAVVLVVSGYLTKELTEEAIKQGAAGAHEKMTMTRFIDLWACIADALTRAPANVQANMKFTSDLIASLTETMSFDI